MVLFLLSKPVGISLCSARKSTLSLGSKNKNPKWNLNVNKCAFPTPVLFCLFMESRNYWSSMELSRAVFAIGSTPKQPALEWLAKFNKMILKLENVFSPSQPSEVKENHLKVFRKENSQQLINWGRKLIVNIRSSTGIFNLSNVRKN